jgi:CBS domain-containing protein
MKHLHVRDFMSRNPVTARGSMSIPELVTLLKRNRVRSAPVVDDDHRILCVITESDLFLRPKGVPFSLEKVPSLFGQMVAKDDIGQVDLLCKQVKVEEVMTRHVTSVGEDATLEDIAMLMYEWKLTLVPVVADGRLVGVVRRIHVLEQIYGESTPAEAGSRLEAPEDEDLVLSLA